MFVPASINGQTHYGGRQVVADIGSHAVTLATREADGRVSGRITARVDEMTFIGRHLHLVLEDGTVVVVDCRDRILSHMRPSRAGFFSHKPGEEGQAPAFPGPLVAATPQGWLRLTSTRPLSDLTTYTGYATILHKPMANRRCGCLPGF